MNTLVTEHLYEHHDALLSRARTLTKGDTQTAHDLVQTTYEKAIKYSDSYNEDGRLANWLHTILRNTFLNDIKRTNVQGFTLSFEEPTELEQIESDKGSHAQGGFINIELEQAYQSIPETFRGAVWLVIGQGYTYNEAAEVLGIPASSVPSKVKRGKEYLIANYKKGEEA